MLYESIPGRSSVLCSSLQASSCVEVAELETPRVFSFGKIFLTLSIIFGGVVFSSNVTYPAKLVVYH